MSSSLFKEAMRVNDHVKHVMIHSFNRIIISTTGEEPFVVTKLVVDLVKCLNKFKPFGFST